ncbi:hypothetical protein A4S06_08580 [Erysipelotrichaceae bacterium MTC7]|nr:hypothetical protein A4S06_08580 [Erysipelotrichaceae bacterium MTC7]
MSVIQIVETATYIILFCLSMWSLTAVRFDKLCFTSNPHKVRLLLILLSFAIAYLGTQFLFSLTIYR